MAKVWRGNHWANDEAAEETKPADSETKAPESETAAPAAAPETAVAETTDEK